MDLRGWWAALVLGAFACGEVPAETGEDALASSSGLVADGAWRSFPIRRGANKTLTIAPSAHGAVQLAWTDAYGVPAGRRRPRCTLDVRVVDASGSELVPTSHNSSRDDNGLEPDPIAFEVPSRGARVEVRELGDAADDFEVRLVAMPPAPPAMPSSVVVRSAGALDADATPAIERAVVLAGGGRDNDAAMAWMIAKGGHGDVVVLRMDESAGGYADYLVERGAHSVREIVFDPRRGNTDVDGAALAELRSAADSEAIAALVDHAEIVFVAGGNQTKYVDAWRGTRLAAAVDRLANERHGVVGGTSAGMHVMGRLVHTPRGGDSVTSAAALADPYITQGEHPGMASLDLAPSAFAIPSMTNVVTDTHWTQRDRLGRSVVLLARAITDGAMDIAVARLVACDEGTALALSEGGEARVFSKAGAAHVIRASSPPARCRDDESLDWQDGLTIVDLPGTPDGSVTYSFASPGPERPLVVRDGVIVAR